MNNSAKEVIKKYLLEGNDPDQKKERFEIAWDIWENFEEIKRDMRKDISKVLINLLKKVDNEGFEEYELLDDGFAKGEDYGYISVFKNNWLIEEEPILYYCVEASDAHLFVQGIAKFDKNTPFTGSLNNKNWEKSNDLTNELKDILVKMKESAKSLGVLRYHEEWVFFNPLEKYDSNIEKKNFYFRVIEKTPENIALNYFNKLKQLKDATEQYIDEFVKVYKQLNFS